MRSVLGVLAASVALLALPVTVAYQLVFGAGAAVVIHTCLGLAVLLLAVAARDFRAPHRASVVGVVSAAGLSTIFFLQALAEAVPNDTLHFVAYPVLGLVPELLFPVAILGWMFTVLVTDSRGNTRIIGWVTLLPALLGVTYAVAFVASTWSIMGLPQEVRLAWLPPFVWLGLESLKHARHADAGQAVVSKPAPPSI